MTGPLSPATRTAEHSPRRHLPLLTALLAVGLDVLPLPTAAPDGVAPLLTLAVLFYWTLWEPELMTPFRTFVVGLLLDLLAGMPLGLSATAFLAARLVLAPSQRFLRAQPFVVIWLCFATTAAVVELLRWALASMWWTHLFSPTPVVDELLLTVAVYPLVSWLLSAVRVRLPRPRYGN